MRKWEYKTERVTVIFLADEELEFLNRLGAEGWELVNIRHSCSDVIYLFKRELGL